MTIGSLVVESVHRQGRPHQLGLVARNASVSGLALAQGNITKRTGASVRGFIGLLTLAAVTENRISCPTSKEAVRCRTTPR